MNKQQIILESEYSDIVITLLQAPYSITSITKILFLSFCIMYENNIPAYINRTKDFVDVFFRNISIKLSAHYEDLYIIFHLLDMLKRTSAVSINGDLICLTRAFSHEPENPFLKFCIKKVPNPIIEINKLDNKALIEEVIRYV